MTQNGEGGARRFPERTTVQLTSEEKLAVRLIAGVRDITESEVMRLFTAAALMEEYQRVSELLGLDPIATASRLTPH